MSIDIEQLKAAAWNTHAKSKKTDAEFQGLVASIKEQGIIQRIVARELEDGSLEIIDGHRRVEAAKEAGLKEVPCDIIKADDETAQMMTATANIQRLENDPLLEAELVERMMKQGKTYKEIAATLGKSESYVACRARLTNLSENWRKAVAIADETPYVSDLEMIAAHEQELQDKVFADIAEDDGSVDWSEDFKWRFNRYKKRLDAKTCGFNISACKGCPHNTATHEFLFADMQDGENEARCQNAECFCRKWNEATDAQIEKLRKKGIAVKEVKGKYDMPNSWTATKNKTKENTIPYVYNDGDVRVIGWSTKKAEAVKDARTKEEIEAEKAEKKRQKILRDARNAMRNHIAEVFKTADIMDARFENLARMCLKRTMTRGWFNDEVCDDYALLVGGVDTLPEEVAKVYAAELKEIEKASAKE